MEEPLTITRKRAGPEAASSTGGRAGLPRDEAVDGTRRGRRPVLSPHAAARSEWSVAASDAANRPQRRTRRGAQDWASRGAPGAPHARTVLPAPLAAPKRQFWKIHARNYFGMTIPEA